MNTDLQQESVHETQVPESESKKTPRQAFFSLHRKKLLIGLVILVAVLGLITREVYVRPVTDQFVRSMASVIPFPAISVNGTVVTLDEYLSEHDALVSFFNEMGDDGSVPSTQEIEDAISETLVNKLAIKQLADEYDVEIDADQVQTYYQDVLASQESEEAFAQEIDQTFGWTTEEFKEQIVESIVLALQMNSFVLESEELQQEREDTILAAYDRISRGEDFATVAKEVHGSIDPSLESDLGYLKLSAIPDEWRSAVEVLRVGQVTDVLALTEGYAIFLVVDSITAGEDTQMHLMAITVPKMTLEELVEDFLETASVKNYVN